ncbi:LytTR family DNA-binding domain-containing protein [Rummeliibacillus suwonensis]|uniref:LytTR family DNA-binding domain-containing protein n=2 Tax=Rummeliibacillus suwonensis TaxID=1306154 RepID=UPI001AAE1CE2|nr:LytTR family DNA-binding domain-containing protein [Rummeliibacillus suwonensis]MBO2535272.1 LytTR family transcriptional regulator DNA-binding domain-containing protein [Rummeliibacillus suwonensis]
MKVQVTIDDQYQEIEVHINARSFDEEVEQLMKQLQMPMTNVIDGYVDQEIRMLKVSEIYTVYVEDGKVYFQTDEEEYQSKKKLYEIEELFTQKFSRVNKSTLVNVDHIRSFQLDILGTTALILHNGTTVHVSRKYLKDLKKKLGIGRE